MIDTMSYNKNKQCSKYVQCILDVIYECCLMAVTTEATDERGRKEWDIVMRLLDTKERRLTTTSVH